MITKQLEELQRIANLSIEDAKKQLLSEVEKQITVEKAAVIKEFEQKTKETADKTAKNISKQI